MVLANKSFVRLLVLQALLLVVRNAFNSYNLGGAGPNIFLLNRVTNEFYWHIQINLRNTFTPFSRCWLFTLRSASRLELGQLGGRHVRFCRNYLNLDDLSRIF